LYLPGENVRPRLRVVNPDHGGLEAVRRSDQAASGKGQIDALVELQEAVLDGRALHLAMVTEDVVAATGPAALLHAIRSAGVRRPPMGRPATALMESAAIRLDARKLHRLRRLGGFGDDKLAEFCGYGWKQP
jgi:hypothetical protein